MHNRKKVDKSKLVPPTEAELLFEQKKRNAFASTVKTLLQQNKRFVGVSPAANIDQKTVSDALALTGKIIRVNPDFYSLWNFRREMLQYQYPEIARGKSLLNEVRDDELQLSQDGIRRNPKSCKKKPIILNGRSS